jgi:hypothetical protein
VAAVASGRGPGERGGAWVVVTARVGGGAGGQPNAAVWGWQAAARRRGLGCTHHHSACCRAYSSLAPRQAGRGGGCWAGALHLAAMEGGCWAAVGWMQVHVSTNHAAGNGLVGLHTSGCHVCVCISTWLHHAVAGRGRLRVGSLQRWEAVPSRQDGWLVA